MITERQARKRAVNVFVDVELIEEARRLRINLSETLERRLRSIVKAERERRWLEDNRAAIASINDFIDRHGLLGNRLRYRAQSE
ncbi:MAG TPA: type II toxin-antitoxin system CcdA family antitoxin [Xanthobacteraceae bacterium]|jgi:antitoxin CcdA